MDDLAKCDAEVFARGVPIMAVDTGPCGCVQFDRWVQGIASKSTQRVDWHYSGGVAQVLFIGERAAARDAILSSSCPGRIMRWFDGEPGLFRAGVTPMPNGARAAWFEGGSGSVFG